MEGVINRVARLARLGYFCCLGLVILAIFTINPVSVSGDEANATTGTATSANTSLSLTTNHDNAVVTITPNSANGTFAMSSAAGEAQFGVTTNNFTGYELSIVADDDNGNLINIDNGITHTISSIPSSITKSSFDTTTYNNKWGYKPNKYLGPNSTIVDNTGDSALFLPSPTTTGTILDHTTVANSSANNYSIALGVRADYNTYAGSYTKNFTLAAIANPTTYIIDYNKNTSDTVANMPTAQSSATSATSITLASNTPERENYNFLGWCTVQTADNTCSGTTYQPGDTYGIDQTTANTVTLYAMWYMELLTIQDITSMQHFGGLSAAGKVNVANSMTTGQAYELIDTRDNEIYHIAKLADGRVWLLDNLRLDLVSVSLADLQGKTNASDTSLNYLKNGGRSTGDNYPTSGVAYYVTQSSDYSYSDPRISTGGACNNTNYCVNNPTSGAWDKNSSINYGSSGGSSKVGAYYNFCAATAGSYCYGSGNSYDYSRPLNENTTEDICPLGWHMPTGQSTGEYMSLYADYNNNYSNFVNALRTPLSGSLSTDGRAGYQNRWGYFWSSIANGGYSYSIYVNGDTYEVVSPVAGNTGSLRRTGSASVRCILQTTISYNISYNSNATDSVSNMPSTQAGSTEEKSFTFSDNIPSRSGYGFVGWCDTTPTTLNGIDSCPGTMYSPGQVYKIDFTQSNIAINLHAMWTSVSLQGITSSTCPTSITYAYDARDYEAYAIQKLADGKCWLLDNLRLDLTNPTVQSNLNESNTNATGVSLSYLMNGGGTSSDKYAINAVGDTWTSSNYSDPIVDTSLKYSIPSNGYQGKIGVYYSYCAASAGSYCYGDGASQGTSSGNATEDVCPAGWRMSTDGEYKTLYTAYSSNFNNFINAFHLPLSGNRRPGFSGPTDPGSYGFFWSSTRRDNYAMYIRRIEVSTAGTSSTSNYYQRYYGLSVRCIIDPTTTGYTITYDKNTSDTVSNMPSIQAGTANSVRTQTTLSNSTPLRSGAGFLGWCSVQPTTSDGEDSCSGTKYQPGGLYTINTSSPDITLYAMWKALPPLSIQSITSSTCTTTPTRVYDARDYEIYTIQRLADGKCWLLDNLRLNLVDVSLSDLQGKTNASDTTLSYLKNGGGTTSDKYATSRVTKWGSSVSYSAPLIATSGSGNNGSWTKDTLQSYGSGSGKIGVYYNYCAVSAGSYCYGDSTSSGSPSGNATEDICPAGWRMPTGGYSGEYRALYAAYSSNVTDFNNALRAPLSGRFTGSQASRQGSDGYFWSSTYYSSSSMYYLYVYPSYVDPQSYDGRRTGYPVRCVLQ